MYAETFRGNGRLTGRTSEKASDFDNWAEYDNDSDFADDFAFDQHDALHGPENAERNCVYCVNEQWA